MPDASRVQRLGRTQRGAVGISITLGLMLAAYGMAGSYETVSDLARREGVPLPELVPVGIDGGIVGVVVLDLVFTWTGQPLGWLRQLVRLLTIGTVVANAAAGWPDPIAVGLHTAAPLMLLTMVEAGQIAVVPSAVAFISAILVPLGPMSMASGQASPGPALDAVVAGVGSVVAVAAVVVRRCAGEHLFTGDLDGDGRPGVGGIVWSRRYVRWLPSFV